MLAIGRQRAGAFAFAFTVSLAVPSGPARAETCLEQVTALAGRFNLEIAPPPPSTSSTTRDRMGIVAPPPATDPDMLQPPPVTDRAMPTTPQIAPDAPPAEETGPMGLDAGERLRLAAVLTAARSAALSGDQAACLDRLGAASELVERATATRGSSG